VALTHSKGSASPRPRIWESSRSLRRAASIGRACERRPRKCALPLTDAAVAGACSTSADDAFEHADRESNERIASGFKGTLASLQTALKPLLDLYDVPANSATKAGAGPTLRALLADVRIAVRSGLVTVTNRATGGIIFSGSLTDLAAGTFTPGNMPAGPGTTPPPPAACTYTYSAWGACQSNSTQSRTVASSSPAGCTGTPVLTQACTYVPPVTTCTSFTYSAWGTCSTAGSQSRTVASSAPAGCTGGSPVLTQACTPPAPAPDGVALYAQKCAGCHGALSSSNLKGKGMTVTSIKSVGMTQGLTDAQLQAVVTAVGP
jgi:hypothetical protein